MVILEEIQVILKNEPMGSFSCVHYHHFCRISTNDMLEF